MATSHCIPLVVVHFHVIVVKDTLKGDLEKGFGSEQVEETLTFAPYLR